MSFHRLYFEQKKKLEYYHNFSIVNFHRCKIEVDLDVLGVHFAQTLRTELWFKPALMNLVR